MKILGYDINIAKTTPEVVVQKSAATTTIGLNHGNVLQHGSGMYTWQKDIDWSNCDTAFDIEKALVECPPISYILFNKALAFINGNLQAVDINSGDPTKNKVALDAIKLMEQPNPLQNGVQFMVQYIMTILAYGYCPVYRFKPVGFPTDRLYILPPNLTQLIKREKLVIGHDDQAEVWETIEFCGINLKNTDVFIFRDIMPSNPLTGLPESRLKNMARVITNVSMNYKARASIMSNRGSIGMWVNQTADQVGQSPVGEKERESIQRDFARHDLTQGDYNTIISNLDYRWEAMSFKIKDLMMTEQETSDIESLADALVYPFKLLAKGGETKYSDRGELKSELYQDTIIPESKNFSQQLRQCLELDKLPVKLIYDYSHLPALQEDKLLTARTLKTNTSAVVVQWEINAITYNQMLVGFGYEEIGKKGEYKYYDTDHYKEMIKQGKPTSSPTNDGDTGVTGANDDA